MKMNFLAFLLLSSFTGIGLAQNTGIGPPTAGQPQNGTSTESGPATVGDNPSDSASANAEATAQVATQDAAQASVVNEETDM